MGGWVLDGRKNALFRLKGRFLFQKSQIFFNIFCFHMEFILKLDCTWIRSEVG